MPPRTFLTGRSPATRSAASRTCPYYAIGCTLEEIGAESDGRMTVELAGRSATGREMFRVVINALHTPEQRRAFRAWEQIRKLALDDPARAQTLLERQGTP